MHVFRWQCIQSPRQQAIPLIPEVPESLAYNEASAISASANSTITVNNNSAISSGSTLNNGLGTPGGIEAGYIGSTTGTGTANLNVTGTVLVNNSANITAAAGFGIEAFNYGNGNVTVS